MMRDRYTAERRTSRSIQRSFSPQKPRFRFGEVNPATSLKSVWRPFSGEFSDRIRPRLIDPFDCCVESRQ